jgi:hypothetical protein
MQVLFPSAFRCGALAMSTSVGLRVAHAQTALRTAQAVCFDVDSTVVTSEGIDDLAAYLGCGDKVAALTAQAMGGSMPFHEALALRLSAMKPSQQQVTSMLAEEPLKLTDGVADLIAVLHSRGQHVYFVSGGACANRPRRQTQNSLYPISMFPVPRNTQEASTARLPSQASVSSLSPSRRRSTWRRRTSTQIRSSSTPTAASKATLSPNRLRVRVARQRWVADPIGAGAAAGAGALYGCATMSESCPSAV